MLKSDLPEFSADLIEVINLFTEPEKVNIRHLFKEGENKVVNTVVVNGQSYAYGNLVRGYKDQIEKKRLLKRYAKLSMYKALSANYNKQLPWGALTGIRPTKLAYQRIKECGEFEDFFVNTMKVSEEKTALTKRVLEGQTNIYTNEQGLTDFFVFIPFCPSKCKYCSFVTSDIRTSGKYQDQYTTTLVREIEHSKKYIKKLRSIYIGGGTPVSISNENLVRILSALDSINCGVEFTVEAGRPDCITKEKLEILKNYRVTRICVNPQTFSDETLCKIGRNHSAKDIENIYSYAKDMFSVNMDFIAGLEEESFEEFKASIDKAIELSPDNITVHTLCLKKGSKLKEEVIKSEEFTLHLDNVSKMVDYAYNKLTENGYNPYYLYRQKYMAENLENVGYCKNGKACIYNIDVMEEISDNIACGANAISKKLFNNGERIERSASPKDIKTYLEKIEGILLAKDKLFG